MVDSCFGLVFILSVLTGTAFATFIFVFFFLSECTLVIAMEIFSTLVHINTCFSCEAFIIHS